MCGQAGVYSSSYLAKGDLDKVHQLIVLNSFRGVDATGAFWWYRHKNNGELKTLKTTDHPFYFYVKTYREAVEEDWKVGANPNLLAIHCRAATVGAKKKENSHPFTHEHITGTHNGTITGDFPNKDQFETDSEALYYNIATMGVKDTIKSLKDAFPAYALVWVDEKEKTLNFLRNSMRPLHITHRGTEIYWSSLAKDLDYAVPEISNEQKTSDGITKGRTLYIEENKHYSIDMTKSGEVTWNVEELKPPVKSYSLYQGGQNKGTHPFQNIPKNTGNGGSKLRQETEYQAYKEIIWPLLSKGIDDFKPKGTYIQPSQGPIRYYAIELDMYFELNVFLTLQLWRLVHKAEFLAALKSEVELHTNVGLGKVLEKAGLSKNEYKRLIRGKYWEFVTEPYRMTKTGNRIQSHFTEWEIKRAIEESNRGNVIQLPNLNDPPFDEDDPADEKEILYPYGVSGDLDSKEFVEGLLDEGCAWCDEQMDLKDIEDVFWISNSDFLCPDCQDKIIAGDIDPNFFTFMHHLPQFVTEREERNDHKQRKEM